MGVEAGAEHDGIFQGQHPALRQVGQHGVRGVAHQRDAAGRPARQWRQTVERPFAPLRHAGQDLRQTGVEAPDLSKQERPVGFGLPVPPLPVLPGDDDDGDLGTAPHGIVHDVHARRQPQADHRGRQSSRLCRRDDGARGGGADELRQQRRADGLPHARPKTVGADECATRDGFAGRGRCPHVLFGLRERGQREAGAQRDAGLGRRGGEQRAVEIAAVRHPVGGAVPRRDPGA